MTYGFVKTDFERPEILVFSSRVNTFVSHLKFIFMRKLFILMMAFLLPVFALEMRADEKVQIKTIPLSLETGKRISRSLCEEAIISCYNVLFPCIQTTVPEDLGEVELNVANLSTGESWSCIFDSATQSQALLPISGSPGYYEIEYTTESGDVYSGELLIE